MDARVEEEQTTKIQNQQNVQNWSEQVEDLIAGGDTEQAITILEAVVSNFEIHTPSETTDLLHASALSDLAKLYSSKSFSLKSEDLKSRAYLLKQRALRYSPSNNMQILQEESTKGTEASHSGIGFSSADGSTTSVDDAKSFDGSPPYDGTAEDDWEAIADRPPEELLSIHCTPALANIALEDTKSQAPKQRGRGTFSYTKHELYSDRSVDYSLVDDVKSDDGSSEKEDDLLLKQTKYGTRHVLVLANFSPSTTTVDLENLFPDFRDHAFVIRWVNDTTALAVFRTPSIALEAFNSVRCSFTVRVLDGHEVLMGSISPRDLEPPRQRPKTSVRTAQRLIAQGMGLKLTSTTFGSQELKSQEEARKHRITARQKLKDDAWGVDE